MGLDVYAGSLTRYYTRDWETVAQRYGREMGMEVRIVRTNEPEDVITDPEKIGAIVAHWRDWIGGKLREEGAELLEWDEREDAPYETDKPDWIGYGSLLVWAAREEHPRWFTQKVMGDDWDKDRSYKRSVRKGPKSRYAQLVMGPEMWLPADFQGVIDANGPTGHEIRIGSLVQLRAQLDLVNERTWRADGPTIESWRRSGFPSQPDVEHLAMFGFSVFYELARFAVKRRVVLLLDY